MTIRRFLHCFLRNGSDPHRVANEITGPVVSCRPGMHQLIEEPDTVAFTAEDREFLRQLGIRTPNLRRDSGKNETHPSPETMVFHQESGSHG